MFILLFLLSLVLYLFLLLFFIWVSGIEPESSTWKAEIITAIWHSPRYIISFITPYWIRTNFCRFEGGSTSHYTKGDMFIYLRRTTFNGQWILPCLPSRRHIDNTSEETRTLTSLKHHFLRMAWLPLQHTCF